MARRVRRRVRTNPLIAAWESAIVPGWGQFAQGRRRVAIGMFRVVVVAVSAGLAAVALGPGTVAGWMVQPSVILILLLINVSFGLFRLFASWDAYRGGGGSRVTAGLVLALLFIAIPHGAIGWTQFRSYQVLNTVFGDSPTRAASTGTTSVQPTQSSGATPVGPGQTTTTTSPTTTTSTVPWEGRERINLLLIGADSGVGRRGLRTDTMILASIGLDVGDVALFGFPRNLSGLVFPDGTTFTDYQGILNEVYTYGVDNPDRYAGAVDPGIAALRSMIEGLSGVVIDYHVLVNLQAFVDIVDALGGVTLYVPNTIVDNDYPKEDGTFIKIRIESGIQELNGSEALAYVRSRHASDDYNRMGRQRCFLTALADQADVPSLLRGLPKLLSTIEENVVTDLPLQALPDLLQLAPKVDASEAIVVGFSPPDWIVGRTERRFPIPDVEKIHEAVSLVLSDPETARALYGLEGAGTACGYGADSSTPPEPTTTTTSTTSTTSTSTTSTSTTIASATTSTSGGG